MKKQNFIRNTDLHLTRRGFIAGIGLSSVFFTVRGAFADQLVLTPAQTEGAQAKTEDAQEQAEKAKTEDAQAKTDEGSKLTSVPDAKALGMSILGNQDAPKSLVIVPWKSSELGDSPGISPMLDDSRQPLDKEVFMRALRYYEIRSKAKP